MRNAFQIDVVQLLALDTRLLTLAKQLLGDDAVPFRATLFDKSPVSNWLVVCHQDTALPLRERREVSGWGHGLLKKALSVHTHQRLPWNRYSQYEFIWMNRTPRTARFGFFQGRTVLACCPTTPFLS